MTRQDAYTKSVLAEIRRRREVVAAKKAEKAFQARQAARAEMAAKIARIRARSK